MRNKPIMGCLKMVLALDSVHPFKIELFKTLLNKQ